jgi:hypothetical protein
MLEHADRHDAVVALGLQAVVLQLEANARTRRFGRGTLRRHGVLLAGQRHAGDVGATFARDIEAEPAPARADVEHLVIRRDLQLGEDVPLLGRLRHLQRCLGICEVSAGILAVAVEEEVVERAVEVVVMRHVALGTADGVALLQPARDPLGAERPREPPGVLHRRHVAAEQVEKIVQAAILDRERAVHVGFADRQSWAQGQPPGCGVIVHADRHGRTRRVTSDAIRPARSVDDRQRPGAQEASQDLRQQHPIPRIAAGAGRASPDDAYQLIGYSVNVGTHWRVCKALRRILQRTHAGRAPPRLIH